MECLRRDATDPSSSRDFGKDIIPYIVEHGKAVAHRFASSCVRSDFEHGPYWRDVGTIDAYWQANIDLTDIVPDLDIYDKSWPIWTYAEITPPAKFVHDDENRRGSAVSSVVSGDCNISARRSTAACSLPACAPIPIRGLKMRVVLPSVKIGRHAQLSNVVIDHGVVIPEGLVVGDDPVLDASASAAAKTESA